MEVDVPEGDQVPEGTQPVGFTVKPQLIKYLYWDLIEVDSNILGSYRKMCQMSYYSVIIIVLAESFFKIYDKFIK